MILLALVVFNMSSRSGGGGGSALVYAIQLLLIVCGFILGASMQLHLRRSSTAAAIETLPAHQVDRTTHTSDLAAALSTEHVVPSPPRHLCVDAPRTCGVVQLFFGMNESTYTAAARTNTADSGFWNAVMTIGRMRRLLDPSSPILLLTNYQPYHIDALRSVFESHRNERQRLRRMATEVNATEAALLAVDNDEKRIAERRMREAIRDIEVLTGGGARSDSIFEETFDSGSLHDGFHNERTLEGMLALADTPWPFDGVDTHVVSLTDNIAGVQRDSVAVEPDSVNDTSLRNVSDVVKIMSVKPDVLRLLVPRKANASQANETTTCSLSHLEWIPLPSRMLLTRYCASVARWLYVDSDTLLTDRSARSWRFDGDDAADLSAEALHRKQNTGTVHRCGFSPPRRHRIDVRNNSSGTNSTRPLSSERHILYSLMDLLAHDDVVMVPEFSNQRDLGPILYQDILEEHVVPDDHANFSKFRTGKDAFYDYFFPHERQYNTGLIAFRGNAASVELDNHTTVSTVSTVLSAFFEDWSHIHHHVERCRNDRVAWDQCSLPRVLRKMSRTLRVASAWEPFNARDALGRGCSTLLFGSMSVRDQRLNREHAVVLHRYRAKPFLGKLMTAAWGDRFVERHVFNASKTF